MSLKKAKQGSYPTVIQRANTKQLIWIIFIVLKEDNIICRGIWPRKGNSISEKSKLTHYKNLAQKVLVFEPKFQLLVTKNNGKAVTHFKTFFKNQIVRLEKGFKEAQKNLGITSGGLLNEDAIWLEDEV